MSAAESPVMIERAVTDDAVVLHEIAGRTFIHATPPGTDPEAVDEFVATSLSEEAFRGHVDSPASRVLIARRGEQAIGYALLLLERPLPDDGLDRSQPVLQGQGVFLSKFYLLPEARGTGASSAMMQECFETGRRIGASFLWLQVNDQNARANAFYERQGLQQVGTATFRLGGQLHSDYLRAVRL